MRCKRADEVRPLRRSASTLGKPLQAAGNAAARPLRPAKMCKLFLGGAFAPEPHAAARPGLHGQRQVSQSMGQD